VNAIEPQAEKAKALYNRLATAIAPHSAKRSKQEASRDLITLGVGFWCLTLGASEFAWNFFDHALGSGLISYCVVRYVQFPE
jgi:hypothetical protein